MLKARKILLPALAITSAGTKSVQLVGRKVIQSGIIHVIRLVAVHISRLFSNGISKMKDNVNHPDHYTQGGVECIDAITAATVNKTGIEAVCTANIIKYLWRYEAKNGLEDVTKAQWYLNRLIAEMDGKPAVAPGSECQHAWVAYGKSKDKTTGCLATLRRCRLCGRRERSEVEI